MMIDLRSDTLTKPTEGMRRAMWQAEVGDDCYGEDPTVRLLEEKCAELFGKESAVFMPSGTMSNQIAIRCNTAPGDEVIIHHDYHVHFFESAQTADLAKVVLNPVRTSNGILTSKEIRDALESKPRSAMYAQVTLVSVENTINAYGGRIYPFEELLLLRRETERLGLRVHMDGARLFNAIVATGIKPTQYGKVVDSLSICFAKGLGAPVGSMLMGTEEFAEKARKYRKWYGGGLHQSGVLAAAALYALENHVDRLAEDHANAKRLAEGLQSIPGIILAPETVETNIVMFDVRQLGIDAQEFVAEARGEGVLLFPWARYTVRAVTNLGINRADIDLAIERLKKLCSRLRQERRGNRYCDYYGISS
ncbi:threonine aldolase family protein [Alicyclobacillus sendaiensis]|uniref:threonine aldolase family protein n=1 Tax=Alicyclobacillus sendaiensis TaxID=192387 RepID=UPI00350E4096